MLDIQFIRDNPDLVKKGTEDKGHDGALVDRVLKFDEERRELMTKVQELRTQRNAAAKNQDREEGKRIKEELKKVEPELEEIEGKYETVLKNIPNMPAEGVKVGKDDSENEIIETVGEPTKFNFDPKDHIELGSKLGIIDIERAAKVSGSRFTYLLGDAVRLEFALVQYAFETLTKKGFELISPPAMTRVDTFQKLGYSEHHGNEEHYLVKGGNESKEEESLYYLIGTAEHSIVPYFMGEKMETGELPKRFVGFSPAFRREAGSYGKDTKGILRLHQFDKVEMVSFTKEEDSDKEIEELLAIERAFFDGLGLPYQVVKMCTGDLGAPAAKKYDINVWIPSQGKYRELTSTSNTTDYQSRRLDIKYREGDETKCVHTLNGTAFAIGRTLIAIIENYQQKDGSVKVPEVLQKWMGKERVS